MSSYDDIPEGYIPCNCHPETCCHRDGLIFVGTNKPKKKSKKIDIQQVCDDCCDGVNVNSQYVGEVFQWLINNGYNISKHE
jgi:hypothetical protein